MKFITYELPGIIDDGWYVAEVNDYIIDLTPVMNWCIQNFGPLGKSDKWMFRNHYSTIFYFANHKDLMLFTLKWS